MQAAFFCTLQPIKEIKKQRIFTIVVDLQEVLRSAKFKIRSELFPEAT